MKTLTLLRHAKSSWDDPVARDFDRPLNARGQRGARVMGQFIRREGLHFDRVIASPALRVVETIDEVALSYNKRLDPIWERRIYLASSASLMDILREVDDSIHSLLLVGHNPGMEDLILDLVPETSGDAHRAAIYEKYPTAALAIIEIAIDHWRDIDHGAGKLSRFTRPRDLDPELGPEED